VVTECVSDMVYRMGEGIGVFSGKGNMDAVRAFSYGVILVRRRLYHLLKSCALG
jgi:hypothetical protein